MTQIAGIDWDDAFDNSGYVDGAGDLPALWAQQAATFRAALAADGRAMLDQPYGTGQRDAYDLFHPATPTKGTVIFVHGGYWRMFDKTYWSHFATGCLDHGWSVAMPSYPLAPQARIADITAAIGRAVTHIAAATSGPLAFVGHSAGGHLVSRMVCKDVLPPHITQRIARVVSVSGVHHLDPLLQTKMNDDLRLTAAEAQLESPVHLDPTPGIPLTFFVGDQERPEFLRQTRMIAERWAAKGANVRSVYDPGTHHFNVIASLRDADGALTNEVLQ